jgi:hypothetical protein
MDRRRLDPPTRRVPHKELPMIRPGTMMLSALALLLTASAARADDLSQYRGFVLGSTLAEVMTTTGALPADVKVLHQRPALIQELRWRLPYGTTSGSQPDPVREMAFRFYDDQLFSIVVEYDRQRIQGLTDGDLIEVMAVRYGPPVLTSTQLASTALASDPDANTVVARWADAASSLTLVRVTYPTSLRLDIALTRVATLARAASLEAVRKDDLEAPQRELDREAQRADDARLAGQKARTVNKPAFRP